MGVACSLIFKVVTFWYLSKWMYCIKENLKTVANVLSSFLPLGGTRSRPRIKSIWSPVEPDQEGVRKRRRDDPVLFHTALVPEAERPWRLWCTWRVWAGPRSTRETHNVSFVLNDCAVGTGLPLSSRCLLSAVKCGNDFCLWTSARFFWEGWVFPSRFLSVPISVSPSSNPSPDMIQWFCQICGEFATKEWCLERGWSEGIDACKQWDQGN